jgi:hypothetical protein
MKKLLLVSLIAATPLLAQAADVNINLGNARVEVPGATITFGSRDSRGYYWDGQVYREPAYWKRHHGPRGEKYYTGHRSQGVRNRGKKGPAHRVTPKKVIAEFLRAERTLYRPA